MLLLSIRSLRRLRYFGAFKHKILSCHYLSSVAITREGNEADYRLSLAVDLQISRKVALIVRQTKPLWWSRGIKLRRSQSHQSLFHTPAHNAFLYYHPMRVISLDHLCGCASTPSESSIPIGPGEVFDQCQVFAAEFTHHAPKAPARRFETTGQSCSSQRIPTCNLQLPTISSSTLYLALASMSSLRLAHPAE